MRKLSIWFYQKIILNIWVKILEPILSWKHIGNFASLTAVILALIGMCRSQQQFISNSSASDSLIGVIEQLQITADNQFDQNKIASDSLIAQLIELQEITSSQLELSKEQVRRAELAAKEIEEYQHARFILDEYPSPAQITYSHNEYTLVYEFNPAFINKGLRSAENIKVVQYIVTNDTVIFRESQDNENRYEPDDYYSPNFKKIEFKTKNMVDPIYIDLLISYQDYISKKKYTNPPEFVKLERNKKVFKSQLCTSQEITFIKQRINHYIRINRKR